tara:strand:- start:316 stop:897 length:582 start_codon:yes stop_codon:yes gene_type:complete
MKNAKLTGVVHLPATAKTANVARVQMELTDNETGEVSTFYYDEKDFRAMYGKLLTARNLTPTIFVPTDFIGINVSGDWEFVAAGEERVLDASHVLVTDGNTLDLDITVMRDKKPVKIGKGEKANIGDVHTYKSDRFRPEGYLTLHWDKCIVSTLKDRIEALKAEREVKELMRSTSNAPAQQNVQSEISSAMNT